MKNKLNTPGNFEERLRNQIGTGGDFPVPEGYFESFNDRLKQRLQTPKIETRPSSRPYYLIGGITAVAAALALAFFLFKPSVQQPATNGSNSLGVNDYLTEPYITYLVYTTSERNLLHGSSSDSLTKTSEQFPSEWTDSKENLDPDAVFEYLYYNNGNVYSIMEWQ